jgi:hypothetical protein
MFGDAVLGVNVFRDLLGGLRDIFGGRSGALARALGAAPRAGRGRADTTPPRWRRPARCQPRGRCIAM